MYIYIYICICTCICIFTMYMTVSVWQALGGQCLFLGGWLNKDEHLPIVTQVNWPKIAALCFFLVDLFIEFTVTVTCHEATDNWPLTLTTWVMCFTCERLTFEYSKLARKPRKESNQFFCGMDSVQPSCRMCTPVSQPNHYQKKSSVCTCWFLIP